MQMWIYLLVRRVDMIASMPAQSYIALTEGVADWTQVEFTLSLLHYNQGNTWRFQIDAGAGDYTSHPLWVDNITIEPVEQPLVIFPTYPNYRGMLWTDQSQTIEWKAVVQPPSGYTYDELYVKVQIVDGEENVEDTVTDSTLEAVETSNTEFWDLYSVTDMQYDASELPVGTYVLRATLHAISGDTLLYAYPDYKIVKEAPSVQRDSWWVYLDEDGRLMTKRSGDSEHGAIFPHIGYTRSQAGYNRPDLFGDLGGTDCCTASASDPDRHRRIIMGCNHKHLPISDITVAEAATVTLTEPHLMSSGTHYFKLYGLAGACWEDFNDSSTWPNSSTFPDGYTISTVTNLDTSECGAFDSTDAYIIRVDCYENDTSFSEFNQTLALDGSGSTMNKVIGDLGINIMIRYGAYPAAWIGQNGIYDCDTYNANNNHVKGYIDALRDVDAWFMTMYNSHAPGEWPMYADWMWGELPGGVCCGERH